MKKRFLILLVIAFCAIYSFTSPAAASGEIELVKDGTTYYLSTLATSETSGQSPRSATVSGDLNNPITGTVSGLFGRPVPTGYVRSFTQLISFILQIVMVIALLLVLFNLVSAGIQWITSGGDKGKVDAARQKIIASIVGIVILASSYALFNLVLYVLGFSTLENALLTIPRFK